MSVAIVSPHEVPKFITVAAASIRTSLSEKSIRRLILAGKLRPRRPVPGRILLSVEELDSLVNASVDEYGHADEGDEQ